MNSKTTYETRTDIFGDDEITRRLMTDTDEAAVLKFTQSLPPHDLLFVRRDVSSPRVVSAWVNGMEQGENVTVVAINNAGEIVGTAALFRDSLSWSAHVGEVRVLINPALRGIGFGRALIEDCFKLALQQGLARINAQMTVDQKAAITIFEELGFRGCALLKDYAQDRDGTLHDIVILSCDVDQMQAANNMAGAPA